ncbi:CocE/NonD family hydrolase [Pedobacter sp. NJ-S-72]
MNKRFCMVLLWLIFSNYGWAQKLYFPKIEATDSIALTKQMPILAIEVLSKYKQGSVSEITTLNNLFRIQMLAGKSADALNSIAVLRNLTKGSDPKFSGLSNMQYELFIKAKNINAHFKEEFATSFYKLLSELDDQSALNIASAFVSGNGIDELKGDFQQALFSAKQAGTLTIEEAIELCNTYQTLQVYQEIEAPARTILRQDDKKRYIIQDSILIKTNDGATLSGLVVRKRGVSVPEPAALFFFIYSNLERSLFEAKYAAAHGYAGVVADTRGKRLSPDQIVPYEYESKDVNTVIDWISKQSWSNGKVGMYGGSYSGFAQWAAAKHLHPALKTIVPYAAAIPGLGLPMENNVFLNANYQWGFYVTNNKYVDNAVNAYNQRGEICAITGMKAERHIAKLIV